MSPSGPPEMFNPIQLINKETYHILRRLRRRVMTVLGGITRCEQECIENSCVVCCRSWNPFTGEQRIDLFVKVVA